MASIKAVEVPTLPKYYQNNCQKITCPIWGWLLPCAIPALNPTWWKHQTLYLLGKKYVFSFKTIRGSTLSCLFIGSQQNKQNTYNNPSLWQVLRDSTYVTLHTGADTPQLGPEALKHVQSQPPLDQCWSNLVMGKLPQSHVIVIYGNSYSRIG